MTILLVDGDIVAYKAAVLSQREYYFDDQTPCVAVNADEMEHRVATAIEEIISGVDESADVVVALSAKDNFRKQLSPTYKANRKTTADPLLREAAMQVLYADYESYTFERLEGDDVLGLIHTGDWLAGSGDTIIVSADKDMRTLPGRYFNPMYPERGIIDISLLDADRFHMWQTMVGDSTDGYPGCYGIGPKSPYAQEILGADREDLWDIVVDAYESKGKTEEDALLQARLAFILRDGHYVDSTAKIKLWGPHCLE